MAVKTDKELSPDARKVWLKALQAMELQNFGYVITLLQGVLREEPEFLQGRQLVRQAEIKSTKGKKSFLSGFSAGSLTAGSQIKKDPKAALEAAEKALENDPYNTQWNTMLRDAAMALGMTETAGFALETIVAGNHKDTKALHELAAHY